MRVTVDENGVCSLSDICPQLNPAILTWRGREVDVAVLTINNNGHALAIDMHVHKQDDNPKRDFVLFTVCELTYHIYRDGFVVID